MINYLKWHFNLKLPKNIIAKGNTCNNGYII